jgi:hypothetical protein
MGMSFKQIGWEDENWIDLAHDTWLALVNTAMNFQVT